MVAYVWSTAFRSENICLQAVWNTIVVPVAVVRSTVFDLVTDAVSIDVQVDFSDGFCGVVRWERIMSVSQNTHPVGDCLELSRVDGNLDSDHDLDGGIDAAVNGSQFAVQSPLYLITGALSGVSFDESHPNWERISQSHGGGIRGAIIGNRDIIGQMLARNHAVRGIVNSDPKVRTWDDVRALAGSVVGIIRVGHT